MPNEFNQEQRRAMARMQDAIDGIGHAIALARVAGASDEQIRGMDRALQAAQRGLSGLASAVMDGSDGQLVLADAGRHLSFRTSGLRLQGDGSVTVDAEWDGPGTLRGRIRFEGGAARAIRQARPGER